MNEFQTAGQPGPSRRRFLGYAAALAGAGVLTTALTGCDNSADMPVNPAAPGVNLGSGDTGVLNYAYALEQLEAAFYTQVLATPYTNMSGAEKAILTDIRDHEIAHREFFRAALGTAAIKDLTPNFSRVDFSSRDVVLGLAKTFEDLGVAAYNGAGKLLTQDANLLMAGKIVSVEARHAATIRDLISEGSFADLQSLQPLGANAANGLNGSLSPDQVVSIAGPYITERLVTANLPTT